MKSPIVVKLGILRNNEFESDIRWNLLVVFVAKKQWVKTVI